MYTGSVYAVHQRVQCSFVCTVRAFKLRGSGLNMGSIDYAHRRLRTNVRSDWGMLARIVGTWRCVQHRVDSHGGT